MDVVIKVLADLATLAAAIIAAVAAFIARQSFQQQKSAATEQEKLTKRQLEIAEDQAKFQAVAAQEQGMLAKRQLQLAETQSELHAAATSMDHLWRFDQAWNSESMLKWRSELAKALIEERKPAGQAFESEANAAFDEVGNLIDKVGYCVACKLIREVDAWELFSSNWEIYWLVNKDRLETPDPTIWNYARQLMDGFAQINQAKRAIPPNNEEIDAFLKWEVNLASVERGVQHKGGDADERVE